MIPSILHGSLIDSFVIPLVLFSIFYMIQFRCVGRALEFLVGLFLLCNSAFILVFESGGAIRAVLVGLHAYFNLWCEARVGWNTFTRRRTAVHKIATLDTVTSSTQIDDVCAICFNDLRSASPNVSSHDYFKIINLSNYQQLSKLSYAYI